MLYSFPVFKWKKARCHLANAAYAMKILRC